MSHVVRCLALAVALGLAVRSAHAVQEPTRQTTLAIFSRGPQFLLETKERVRVPVDMTRTPSLQRRITVNLDGVPMRRALAEVAEQAGIRLMYPDDIIPMSMPVRLRAESITVAAALTDLLMDAGVDVVFTPAGDASLVRRPPPPPPVEMGAIVGQVTDAKTGRGLENADVALEGTKWRSQSGSDGRYRLADVTAGTYTLVVRRIGYQRRSQSLTLAGSSDVTIDLGLEPSAIDLDEVVVTGTPGAVQRRTIGNALAKVDAADILQVAPIRNVGDLLNGRVAGVVIMPGTGMVGAGPRVQIRGRTSISLRSEALIYIDGFRVSNDVASGPALTISRLGDLNPRDIESIEVIRGPAAATLYGTEASNGVIQIITKKGRAGDRSTLGASIRQGANWFMNPEGRIANNVARDPASGQIVELNLFAQEAAAGRPIFRTGHVQGYGVDLTGGSNTVQYYAAGDFDREEGIEPTNHLNRLSGRANVTVRPSDAFDVSLSVGLVDVNRNLSPEGGVSTLFGVLYAQPRLRNTPTRGFNTMPPEAVWSAFRVFQAVKRYTAGVNMNHRPTSWLSHRLTVGTDGTAEDNQTITEIQPDSIGQFLGATARAGRKRMDQRLLAVTTFDYSASAAARFTGSLSSKTSIGAQYYHTSIKTQYSEGRGFPAPGVNAISSAAQTFGGDSYVENATVGVYVEQQFSLRDRLFVTGAVRADDNSAFGEKFELVKYPKVSGTWVISEEPFWSFRWVDALKLRAAYGQSGQQPQNFAAFQTYAAAAGLLGPTVTPLAPGNPNLAPERGEEIEVGFETSLWNSRVGIDFTFYNKRTKNTILLRDVPPSGGFPGRQFVNAGLITNKGIELLLNTKPIESRSVTWDLALSLSTNDNRIIDLDPTDPSLTFLPLGGFARHEEGHAISAFFRRKVVSATIGADGRATNLMCDGGTPDRYPGGAPVPCNAAPLIDLGRPTPKYEGGITSSITVFNNLRVHAQVDFKGGHKIADLNNFLRCPLLQLCRENVDPAAFDPAYIAEVQTAGSTANVSSWIVDGTFAKLREVSLSYTLPTSWARKFGVRRASLTVAGRNLHTWTGYRGLDPEGLVLSGIDAPGIDQYAEITTTPQLASFRTQINLTF